MSATRDAQAALGFGDGKAGLRDAVLRCWFGPNPPPAFSLPEQIALDLSTRILSLEIEPGARIVEQDVADHFRVSRGPVREALRILEREKLVVVSSRKGCTVTTLSREEVYDVFEVRAALSSLASHRLAEKRSKAALAILDTLLERGGAVAGAEDGSGAYVKIVFEYGLQLIEAAGSSTISQLLASLGLQTMRYSLLGLGSTARRRESLRLWKAERKAIAAGDAQAASEAAVERIRRSRDETLRVLALLDDEDARGGIQE